MQPLSMTLYHTQLPVKERMGSEPNEAVEKVRMASRKACLPKKEAVGFGEIGQSVKVESGFSTASTPALSGAVLSRPLELVAGRSSVVLDNKRNTCQTQVEVC